MLLQLQFLGRESLGVHARANDRFCLAPPNLPEDLFGKARDALDVPVHRVMVGGSTIVGALVAMNSRGILVADIATDEELAVLSELGLPVGVLGGVVNAAGNSVLCNDRGALVDPRCPKPLLQIISDTLDVDTDVGTLGGVRTPATAGLATNKGALLHPKATEPEIALLEELLGVKSRPGTINHGSPYVGSGVVANSKGALIGTTTTGPELNRLEDALDYL